MLHLMFSICLIFDISDSRTNPFDEGGLDVYMGCDTNLEDGVN